MSFPMQLVDKICNGFLENGSLIHRRRIKKYRQNQIEFKKDWKLVTIKASIDTLQKLAINLEKFFKLISDELTYQVSPHEIAAYQGTVALYKHIFEQTKIVLDKIKPCSPSKNR